MATVRSAALGTVAVREVTDCLASVFLFRNLLGHSVSSVSHYAFVRVSQ